MRKTHLCSAHALHPTSCLPTHARSEGLSSVTMRAGLGLTDEQLLTSKIVSVAANPPPEAGRLQRRTSEWLLRPCTFAGTRTAVI